ncbi:26202_t:CDS:2, partial [Dentiscutata erythropus]
MNNIKYIGYNKINLIPRSNRRPSYSTKLYSSWQYNQSYDCNRIQSKFDFEPSNTKSNKDNLVKEVVKITSNYNLQDENYIDSIEL